MKKSPSKYAGEEAYDICILNLYSNARIGICYLVFGDKTNKEDKDNPSQNQMQRRWIRIPKFYNSKPIQSLSPHTVLYQHD